MLRAAELLYKKELIPQSELTILPRTLSSWIIPLQWFVIRHVFFSLDIRIAEDFSITTIVTGLITKVYWPSHASSLEHVHLMWINIWTIKVQVLSCSKYINKMQCKFREIWWRKPLSFSESGCILKEIMSDLNLKSSVKWIPWWFNGQDSTFSLLRAQVDSLVRELRFQKPHTMTK